MSAKPLFFCRNFVGRLLCRTLALFLTGSCTLAFGQSSGMASLPSVTVSAQSNLDPVEKSYRKMVRGMELFEREHRLAPGASLQFKLLPRLPDTNMQEIYVEVVGKTVDFPVAISADKTFSMQRNPKALEEDAQVVPNRKAQSMTWRTDIRTPGLPLNTRRLGDLRLECKVGMEAGLISNSSTVIGQLVQALIDGPSYCDRPAPQYLFFADRPLFRVAMISQDRKEVLAIDKLYAGASDDPGFKKELPYCDCEVLLDRTYVLPLGDRSWPDDTLIEFEYMDE